MSHAGAPPPGALTRVAIVRLTSLGDVVHTLPIAHALRRHRPRCHVVWIVEEREQALLVDNPVVDELVIAPTRRWRRELRSPGGGLRVLREFNEVRKRLRALRLEVAIDVQGFPKSSLFTVMTRAPVRIGFGWHRARDPVSSLFTTHWVTPPPEAAHIVDQNLCLLEPLGIRERQAVFPLPMPPPAEARADAALRARGVGPRQGPVALLPATRGAAKQWPADRYRELARRLAKETGLPILVLGGPGEEALIERVCAGLGGLPVFHLAPAPISDLIALLRRARLAIGNDTGPLHVAAALGVPTVGLYGPTRAGRNGPYGPRSRAIQSSTGRVADIRVDTVLSVAASALGG